MATAKIIREAYLWMYSAFFFTKAFAPVPS